jgi:hypothetical protein
VQAVEFTSGPVLATHNGYELAATLCLFVCADHLPGRLEGQTPMVWFWQSPAKSELILMFGVLHLLFWINAAAPSNAADYQSVVTAEVLSTARQARCIF